MWQEDVMIENAILNIAVLHNVEAVSDPSSRSVTLWSVRSDTVKRITFTESIAEKSYV